MIPFSSSRRPKWLKRKLRDLSRSTSSSAGHDSSSSSGASKSFSTHAEYKFSVPRFHASRTGQTLPGVARGGPVWIRLTAILRVTAPHPAGAPSRTSLACHIPTAGEATSANQKYGGPPCTSRDLGAAFPSGAISESSPSSGSSAAKTAPKGAPLHGAIGEDKTATSPAPAQLLPGSLACKSDTVKRKTKNALATKNAVRTTANWRAVNN